MGEAGIWWLLAGAAIAVELMTGTFYLLMLAAGLAAGALAATMGIALTGQMLLAAGIGGGAVAAWRWGRRQRPAPLAASSNPDVHLDIGNTVHVVQWNADGTAGVHFRGARWTAVPASPNALSGPGNFRITEVRGNHLVIEPL